MVYEGEEMAGEPKPSPMREEEAFAEKSFYLDEFHEKTLLFALAPDAASDGGVEEFLATARELIREDVRLVVVVADAPLARRLEQRLRRLAAASFAEPLFPAEDQRSRRTIIVETQADEPGLPVLLRLWSLLRAGPIAVVLVPEAGWPPIARTAVRLAARLKVHKLVLVDPEGGVQQGKSVISFLDEAVLTTLLTEGEAEWSGLGHRRPLIEVVRDGLISGVPAINLCRLPEVGRELFTYEGSGTLFTLEDYCRVERLGIDDFREVERLLERGQRGGYLKIRSPEQIGEILFTGYGATIGAGHLAGVGALLSNPYAAENVGEIVGLYTISRFKGEGVGARLLARIEGDASERKLRALFACTTQEGAMGFFRRHGFRDVESEAVPAAKWRGYDPERIRLVTVFWKDLETGS